MSSVQKRFIRRAVVVLVALYAYLGYTYLASVYTHLASLGVYVLYAFPNFTLLCGSGLVRVCTSNI